MAFLQVSCPLLLILTIVRQGECETFRHGAFRKVKQKYLRNHVIDRKQAGSESECVMYCLANDSCASVNFKTSGIDKGLCELNNLTLPETSDDVESPREPEFDHIYSAKKTAKDRVQQSLEARTTQEAVASRHECTSYTSLGNSDRNVNYVGSSEMCDNGISTGWYRFVGDAGTKISSTCIPRDDTTILKCSTHGVSWLNGAHPSVQEGKVTRTVCFSWSGNCCYYQRDTEVINCGPFYIYKLVSTGGCSHRYCGTDV